MKNRTLIMLTLITILAGLVSTVQPVMADDEWYAEYFNNTGLVGEPVLTTYIDDLHFELGTGSPGTGVNADHFSLRMTRDVYFEGGTYRFSYKSDDGIRIWINDTLAVNRWQTQDATWHATDAYVPPGVNTVRIEYYEFEGHATFQLGWDKVYGSAAWQGVYFSNTNLAGQAVLTRQDEAIDFDWGYDSPDSNVPTDEFSVRWARTLGFEAGTYRFYAAADDGVRIYVDSQLIVDSWITQQLPNTHTGDIALAKGSHEVIIDYYEQGGEAAVHAWWDRIDDISGTGNGLWEGRYFDNDDLIGGPALIRAESEINFDWGEGSPAAWIPSDDFSAQWIQTIDFTPGLYRFNVRADDGTRLWIDDSNLLLNHWSPQDNEWHYQDWHYLEGSHTLRLEYFEQAGSAKIQFWWDYAADATTAQNSDPSPVYHTDASTPAPVSTPDETTSTVETDDPIYPGPWQAEYFLTRDMRKDPVVVRTDPAINFDWGWESAVPEQTSTNNFAIRWTGDFDFDGGTYRFTTTTDDGVRLYVDGDAVIDNFRPMRGTRYNTISLEPGTHTVVVEYFEALEAAKAQVTWEKTGD